MTNLRRRAQPWLGTLVSIDVVLDNARFDVDGAFARGFAAVARVHESMSAQRPASDVARFNAARRGEIVLCDPWTIQVLRIAATLREASGGLFDVTLGAGAIYRIVDARGVLKLRAGSRLELGGVAKGYAVDRAVAALRAGGVRRGLVNAGGDLRAFGKGAWPVALRGAAGGFALERGAIATSEYRDGRSPHHADALIAPATATMYRTNRTITVAAPRCALADAMTKVIALTDDPRHPLLVQIGGQAWLR